MNISKQTQDREEKVLANISPSRYIGHMSRNGNHANIPAVRPDYLGNKGVLFRADCLDLLANIEDNSVDLVFVDPPFNLGKDYKLPNFTDNMESEAYRSWCRSWLLELTRVLRPGGALFVYHWPKWLMDLGGWLNTLPALTYKSWIAMKMKSGFPIKGRLHPAHYGMLYYVKKGAKSTFHVVRAISPTCRHCGKLIRDYGGYRSKFTRYEDESGTPWIQISDFWEDTRPARADKSRAEINELPLHVPERAILMASNPGDVVLDCFIGAGSTAHAAQTHDRYWIGGEIGDTTSILRRVATFIGTEETSAINPKLAKCFKPPFLRAMIKEQRKTRKRPIQEVGTIKDVVRSMDRYASKSKVLGY